MGKSEKAWRNECKINGHNGNGNGNHDDNSHNSSIKFVKADVIRVACAIVFGTGLDIIEFGLGIPASILKEKIGRNISLGPNGDLRCAVPEVKPIGIAAMDIRFEMFRAYIRTPGLLHVRDSRTKRFCKMTTKEFDRIIGSCTDLINTTLPSRLTMPAANSPSQAIA